MQVALSALSLLCCIRHEPLGRSLPLRNIPWNFWYVPGPLARRWQLFV